MTEDRLNYTEIDLKEIYLLLKRNIKFILTFFGIFTFLGVLYSLFINNIYTAKTTFMPTSLSQSADINSSAFNFSSFSMLDINQGDPNVDIAIAYVNSLQIIEELSKFESFLPDLMASIKWDLDNNELTYDHNIFDKNERKWVREVDPPYNVIPSAQEAQKIFSKSVSISQDKTTNLVKLSVDHISPYVARTWALWIAEEVNSFVANLRINEYKKSIEFLDEQIQLSPYAEVRTSLYELMQKKIQQMMLAKVNPEYVLTTIDPPVVAEIHSTPNRILIIAFAAFFSLCFGAFIVLIKHFFNL